MNKQRAVVKSKMVLLLILTLQMNSLSLSQYSVIYYIFII